MSDIRVASTRVYEISKGVLDGKKAYINWADKKTSDVLTPTNNISASTYRNGFIAFFGRVISGVFKGEENKSLKNQYIADVKACAKRSINLTDISDNAKVAFFQDLSKKIDGDSRRPLSARVVKLVEADLDSLCPYRAITKEVKIKLKARGGSSQPAAEGLE